MAARVNKLFGVEKGSIPFVNYILKKNLYSYIKLKMNGYGQTPDLKCNSLSLKSKTILDRSGKLYSKKGQIKDLQVKKIIVDGTEMNNKNNYSFTTTLDYNNLNGVVQHMFNGPVGVPHNITLQWRVDGLFSTPTSDIFIDELPSTTYLNENGTAVNTFGPFVFSAQPNAGISSVVVIPTISPSIWNYRYDYGFSGTTEISTVHITEVINPQ